MKYCFDYLDENCCDGFIERALMPHFVDKKLGYTCVDGGIVLPGITKDGTRILGGVVSSNGDFIDSSAWHEGPLGGGYSYDASAIQPNDNDAIFIGYLHRIWGHMLTDCLKKLWFLFSDDYSALIKNAKVVYITVDNMPLPKHCKELFTLAGLNIDSWEHITTLTKFRNVIVPDNSLIATFNSDKILDSALASNEKGRVYTKQYVDIINRIKSNVIRSNVEELKKFDKIYLTRTRLKSNKDCGEKNVEKLFAKAGYTVIAPEKFSLAQQIYFMMNVKQLAVTEGSIAHNAAFCTSGTNLVILRKVNYVNGYQFTINEMADLNVTYIDANHSSLLVNKNYPNRGPFYLCNTKQVQRFLNIQSNIPYFLCLDWAEYCCYALLKRVKAFIKSFIRRTVESS